MSDLSGRMARLAKRLGPADKPLWAELLLRKPRFRIPGPEGEGSDLDILTQEEADRLNAAGYRTLFIPETDDRPEPDPDEL